MSTLTSMVDVINWLQVLASPHIFGQLGRTPERELLLRRIDAFINYVRRGGRITDPMFPDPPYAAREERAVHLRSLLEQWTPPELSEEIVAAARALLYAEGFNPPGGWDAVPQPPEPMADCLIWS